MMRRVFFFAAATIATVFACVGEDPGGSGAGPLPGTRGGACNDGRCLTGLTCIDKVCVSVDASDTGAETGAETGAGSADSGTDADASVLDADAGCPSEAPFTPTPIKNARPPAGSCPAAQLDTLATACSGDLGASACTEAQRNGNAVCVACVFTREPNDLWGPVILDDNPPPGRYNHAACIDSVTGVPGCGREYMTFFECVSVLCEACGANGACVDKVSSGACRRYSVGSPNCTNALNAKNAEVQANCFPRDNTPAERKAFFMRIASMQCSTP